MKKEEKSKHKYKGEKYVVAVENCNSYKNIEVKRALLNCLREIDFSFSKIKNVLIKPNLLSPAGPDKAITTHPTVIEELCKILKEKGVKKIYIGDSSAYSTDSALKVCGMKQLEKYPYVKVINFEAEDKRFFNFGKQMTKVPLPKIAFQVDLVINVAKMKTHGLTLVTLCGKNLYGCIPGSLKEKYHAILPSPKRFARLIHKIDETINPQLNIIDGVTGIESEGPAASGKIKNSKLILASKSIGAIDIVGSRIMGFNPKSIYINKLVRIKEKNIEVKGSAKDVRLKFIRPKSANIIIFLRLSSLFPKPKIKFDYSKCTKCGTCGKKCPVGAITYNPYPVWDSKKCIRCLCCIEVCPAKAISLEQPWIRRALEDIGKKFIKY